MRPTPLEIIKNMREKNFREEVILEEVEKELKRPQSPSTETGQPKYTLAQIRQAGKEGEVNHLDVEHIIDLLKEQPCKPMTADKEAIKDEIHNSMMLKGGNTHQEKFEWLLNKCYEYLKENEELKATNIKLRFDKLQLETLRDELQQSCDDKNHVMKSWWASLEEADVKIKALQSSNEAKDREIAELKEALTHTEKAYEIMRDKSERLEKEVEFLKMRIRHFEEDAKNDSPF